jgi:monoamine oxidase
LKTAAAGAAAAGIAGATSGPLLRKLFPPAIAQEPKSINSAIVIGSGFGGLTTAMLLADMGKQVTVIEKCHRPGGRCQQKNYPNGQHSTVGYMEWYDTDLEMFWLVNELGYAKKDYYAWPDPSFYQWRGEYHYETSGWTKLINELPWDDAGGPADEFAFEDYVWRYGDTAIEPFDDPASTYQDYDYTDFEDWMLTNHRSDVTEFWDINHRSEFGCPTYRQSAGMGLYSSYYWSESNSYALNDGNYGFIERMVQRLPAGSLKLNTAVSSVENTATGVKVTAKGKKYTADVAIVAVPHINVAGIVPELPSNRVAALESLGSLKSIVCLQQYTEPFWETIHGVQGWGGYSDHGVYGTTRPGSYCIDVETVNQNAQPEGILSEYINEPETLDFWSTYKGIHAGTNITRNVTGAMLDDIENYWPEVRNYLINNSERAYMWEPYVPAYEPRYVLDGTYALNRIPIGNIYFAADYIYDSGGNSAVLAAKDAVANFT